MERGGHYIHLSITNHDVAICAKPFYMPILVDIIMIGIKKIAVTDNQIRERVFKFTARFWISAKYIKNSMSVVHACRHVTICIKIGFTTRVFKSFNFIPFGIVDKREA